MVRFGGRKFVGFIIILAAGAAVRYFSKTGLTHEDVMFLIAAYSAFAFGNVVNTIAALKGGGSSGQSGAPAVPAPVDFAPIESRISSLEQTSSAILGGVQLQNQALEAVLMRLAGNSARPAAPTEAADPELAERALANRAAISQYVRPN